MAKEKAPHMPWYGREFYGDENVIVMTLEQEAAYLRLLWNCWQEGSIPTDVAKLAAICKNTQSRKFERDIWPAVSGCFSSTPEGRLVHPKVELLRTAKEQRRTVWSEAGKRGNEKRWGGDRVPDANPINTRPERESGPDSVDISADCRLPITDYQISNTCASDDARMGPTTLFLAGPMKPAKPENGLNPNQEIWFSEWWPAYWLKKARKAARQAFGKHVKTPARFEQVMAATRAQEAVMLKREPQHRPHGATWLNGERWEDETTGDVPANGDTLSTVIDRMYSELEAEKTHDLEKQNR